MVSKTIDQSYFRVLWLQEKKVFFFSFFNFEISMKEETGAKNIWANNFLEGTREVDFWVTLSKKCQKIILRILHICIFILYIRGVM